jgi:uncharacterized membrane protein YsdA (DUF1294 family)
MRNAKESEVLISSGGRPCASNMFRPSPPACVVRWLYRGALCRARKISFRRRYRTVLLAVVVFGGETGALMTIAREKTNWAAHLYVYLALMSLGIAMLYLALAGPDRFKNPDARDDESRGSGRT